MRWALRAGCAVAMLGWCALVLSGVAGAETPIPPPPIRQPPPPNASPPAAQNEGSPVLAPGARPSSQQPVIAAVPSEPAPVDSSQNRVPQDIEPFISGAEVPAEESAGTLEQPAEQPARSPFPLVPAAIAGVTLIGVAALLLNQRRSRPVAAVPTHR